MSDDDIDRDELPEVCIVVNGSVEMTEGKLIGQVAQGIMRALYTASKQSDVVPSLKYAGWFRAKTRTIVKTAKTPAIFERICEEVPGYVMRDEGFTEVEPDTPTVFVSYPYLHKDRPQVLNNKKCPLM